MIKILHAADFHMDSAFDALTDIKASERRQDQRRLVEDIIKLAVAENVQIILLSGDLFDSKFSYYETSEVLTYLFSSVKAHVFISPGNHDYYCSESPYSYIHFPENVHIFKSQAIEKVHIDELNCDVYGAGFVSSVCPSLLNNFRIDDENAINIMTIHGDITVNNESPYNPISNYDIEHSGLDYLALGHVHTFSGIKKLGKTSYAYPGCPEGRGFDELGQKGCIIGTVDKNSCVLEFRPLEGRKYEIKEINITDADLSTTILSSLPDNTSRDIYRIILTGESSEIIDIHNIEALLAERFYAVSVLDLSEPKTDLWSERNESSLRGLFINNLYAQYQSANESEKETINMALKYGLAAIDNREENNAV